MNVFLKLEILMFRLAFVFLVNFPIMSMHSVQKLVFENKMFEPQIAEVDHATVPYKCMNLICPFPSS